VARARKFYEHLADPVDVRGTDQADLATVQHEDDGSLRLTLSPLGAGMGGAPCYVRRFSPKETHEIRLYLLGGDDRVVATGANRDRIHLRVLGGDGNDTVDDSRSGGLDVQDPHGIAVQRGPGTNVSDHEWTNPAPEPDRPWLEPRNYGHWTVPVVEAWWQPNQALMVGGGFTRTSWGFRKYPWANMQSFTLLYSSGYNNVRATYLGQCRLSDTGLVGAIAARWSGIENMNFYGPRRSCRHGKPSTGGTSPSASGSRGRRGGLPRRIATCGDAPGGRDEARMLTERLLDRTCGCSTRAPPSCCSPPARSGSGSPSGTPRASRPSTAHPPTPSWGRSGRRPRRL
jgi:hypothetical protein